MIITYAPRDGTPEPYTFKPLDTLSFDAERIEAVGGDVWDNYDDFILALSKGKMRALRAALWICLRKDNPKMTFPELVVGVREITFGPDDEELDAARKTIAEDESLSDDEKAEILLSLGKDEESDPSAPSESDTDSSSPEPASEA